MEISLTGEIIDVENLGLTLSEGKQRQIARNRDPHFARYRGSDSLLVVSGLPGADNAGLEDRDFRGHTSDV